MAAYQSAVQDLTLETEFKNSFGRVQGTLGLMINTFYRPLQNAL
jgi:hypothetical protein